MPNFEIKTLSHTNDIERERDSSRTPKIPGTYIIENENKEIYIGSSEHLTKRLQKHKSMIKNGVHPHEPLNNSNVVVKVIQTDDRNMAYDLEQKFLDENRNNPKLLNKALDARFPGKGITPSEANIEAIKKAHTGKIVSEETRKKLSIANSGRTLSEEQKEHLRLINTGKTHSEETKKKLSEMLKGRAVSEETAKKISEAKKGKGFPEKALQASLDKNSKRVSINGVEYKSLAEAGKALNRTPEAISSKIKRGKDAGFKFI